MDCIQCFVGSHHSSQEVQVRFPRPATPFRQYAEHRPKPLELGREASNLGKERTSNSYVRPPTPYPYEFLSRSHGLYRDVLVKEARRRPRRRVAYVLVTREHGKRYYQTSKNHERQYIRPGHHQRKRVSFAEQNYTTQSRPVRRQPDYDEVTRSFSNLKLDPGSGKPSYIVPH
jgi:hypothetical protein